MPIPLIYAAGGAGAAALAGWWYGNKEGEGKEQTASQQFTTILLWTVAGMAAFLLLRAWAKKGSG